MIIKPLDFRDCSVHTKPVSGLKQPISASFNACHVSLAHKSLNPFLDGCLVLPAYFWFTNHAHISAENSNTTVSTIFKNAETLRAL